MAWLTLFSASVMCLAASAQGSQDHYTDQRPFPVCEVCEERSNQNLAQYTVNAVNSQIRMGLNASQIYMAMAAHFTRNDMAYRGFAKYFMKASEDNRAQAVSFMDYLNQRGGIVALKSIHAVEQFDANYSPLYAVMSALQLEREVNSALLDLHWAAQGKNDVHLQRYLEREHLSRQVDVIQKLASWQTILYRLDRDALFQQFDEELWAGTRG